MSWYAIIMGQPSLASKQLVQAHNDWTNVDRDKNPLLLWQLITATHLAARTGNPALDKRAALLAFNTILPDYSVRVQVLEAIKHLHIPSAKERYSQHIQNDTTEGVAPPATIAKAEHEAEHWRPEISIANTSRNQSDTPKGSC